MYPAADSNKLVSMINSSIMDLPTPSNISYMWNFGSLLGTCLVVQIVSGLFLAMHYGCDVSIAFYSVNHIMRDVNLGWLLRAVHSNGASMFFICLYLHMGRGMYYGSYNYAHVWAVGCTILLLTMATAFLGYVLPWGQMSFWGATVITNLFSAIPYVGHEIVYWMWGGFAVDNASLTRFFALHFLLPFIIAAFSAVHLFFLHLTGSSNPLGVTSNSDKIKFSVYFGWKDILGMVLMLQLLMLISMFNPWVLGDPENFIPANPLVTPIHIQPEWYFLFAYAILRSIPNKLGGVVALALSVAVYYIMPALINSSVKSNQFLPANKFMFWVLVGLVLMLTWIGARPVENPYIIMGQILSLMYFSWFFINYSVSSTWMKVI